MTINWKQMHPIPHFVALLIPNRTKVLYPYTKEKSDSEEGGAGCLKDFY